MGSLNLPSPGEVYFDAQCVIYTVERHQVYAPLLDPVWRAVQAKQLTVVSSELTILEALVGPIKHRDAARLQAFDNLFSSSSLRLVPITPIILRRAAQLRAALTRLRTPDAIHAATALEAGAALFVTNDLGFRNVPGLPVVVLQDLLATP